MTQLWRARKHSSRRKSTRVFRRNSQAIARFQTILLRMIRISVNRVKNSQLQHMSTKEIIILRNLAAVMQRSRKQSRFRQTRTHLTILRACVPQALFPPTLSTKSMTLSRSAYKRNYRGQEKQPISSLMSRPNNTPNFQSFHRRLPIRSQDRKTRKRRWWIRPITRPTVSRNWSR